MFLPILQTLEAITDGRSPVEHALKSVTGFEIRLADHDVVRNHDLLQRREVDLPHPFLQRFVVARGVIPNERHAPLSLVGLPQHPNRLGVRIGVADSLQGQRYVAGP